MKAHELLEDPKSWTKELWARDADGDTVNPSSENAVCWCVWGAVAKVYPVHLADKALDRIQRRIGTSIPAWNDAPERTHAEVCALLKELDI